MTTRATVQAVPAGPAQALTFEETAKRLAVSQATLSRMIERGTIPSIKIGRSRRFLEEDIDAYLRSLRTPQSA